MIFVIILEWPRFKPRIDDIRSALAKTVIHAIAGFFILHCVTFILWPKFLSGISMRWLYMWLSFLIFGGIYSTCTFFVRSNIFVKLFRGFSGIIMIAADIALWGLTRDPINDFSWWVGRHAVRIGLWGAGINS